MAISAKDVKELREKTGAGMMDCKKALTETSGNMEEAIAFLRTKGLAAAEKKQNRVAAEGTVVTVTEGNKAVLLEVNCETDFVSKGDEFQNFALSIASHVLKNNINDLDSLKKDRSEAVNEMTLKCGEKIDLRRLHLETSKGAFGTYNHGGKIGVIVNLETSIDTSSDAFSELSKDLAMHVAAAAPTFLSADEIDEDFKQKEATIYKAQLIEQGKPEKIIDNIIKGKLNKLASDVCFLEQKFVKDPDFSISKLLVNKSKELGGEIKISDFKMLKLGDGIEKKEDNLADEVAKMSGQK